MSETGVRTNVPRDDDLMYWFICWCILWLFTGICAGIAKAYTLVHFAAGLQLTSQILVVVCIVSFVLAVVTWVAGDAANKARP